MQIFRMIFSVVTSCVIIFIMNKDVKMYAVDSTAYSIYINRRPLATVLQWPQGHVHRHAALALRVQVGVLRLAAGVHDDDQRALQDEVWTQMAR